VGGHSHCSLLVFYETQEIMSLPLLLELPPPHSVCLAAALLVTLCRRLAARRRPAAQYHLHEMHMRLILVPESAGGGHGNAAT